MKDPFFEKFSLMEKCEKKKCSRTKCMACAAWCWLQMTAAPIVVCGYSAAAAKALTSFRRWRRRAGAAKGAVPKGSCVWVGAGCEQQGGCASLAMPFFVLCTRIELLFPCSFVLPHCPGTVPFDPSAARTTTKRW